VWRRILKRLLLGVAVLLAALLVASAAGLAYRAYRQHETAQLLVLNTPDAIDESSFVRIGGVDQWIQVRGEKRNNPVILFLHGGPGFTAIPYFQRVMRTWERDFTIVHWDQRGAGKSYARNGGAQQPHPTIDQMIADGIEVAEHVRHRLGQAKVVLVGYSWGSVLGIEMARKRPDLFHAFVGTGQVIDTVQSEKASYYGLLQLARAAGDDESAAALIEIGPPPYARFEQLGRQRQILNKYPPTGERDLNQFKTLLLAPGYSLRDVMDVYFRAPELTREMLAVVLKYKVTDRGVTFDVPLFFFQGAEDLWTSPEVVKMYLPLLTAPRKEIVLFEHVGHHAVESAGERFLAELNARVRPLAQQLPMSADSSHR
jgi:proline iminopeptidase